MNLSLLPPFALPQYFGLRTQYFRRVYTPVHALLHSITSSYMYTVVRKSQIENILNIDIGLRSWILQQVLGQPDQDLTTVNKHRRLKAGEFRPKILYGSIRHDFTFCQLSKFYFKNNSNFSF